MMMGCLALLCILLSGRLLLTLIGISCQLLVLARVILLLGLFLLVYC